MFNSDKQRKWFWAAKTKQAIGYLHKNKSRFNRGIDFMNENKKQISEKVANRIVETNADKDFIRQEHKRRLEQINNY